MFLLKHPFLVFAVWHLVALSPLGRFLGLYINAQRNSGQPQFILEDIIQYDAATSRIIRRGIDNGIFVTVFASCGRTSIECFRDYLNTGNVTLTLYPSITLTGTFFAEQTTVLQCSYTNKTQDWHLKASPSEKAVKFFIHETGAPHMNEKVDFVSKRDPSDLNGSRGSFGVDAILKTFSTIKGIKSINIIKHSIFMVVTLNANTDVIFGLSLGSTGAELAYLPGTMESPLALISQDTSSQSDTIQWILGILVMQDSLIDIFVNDDDDSLCEMSRVPQGADSRPATVKYLFTRRMCYIRGVQRLNHRVDQRADETDHETLLDEFSNHICSTNLNEDFCLMSRLLVALKSMPFSRQLREVPSGEYDVPEETPRTSVGRFSSDLLHRLKLHKNRDSSPSNSNSTSRFSGAWRALRRLPENSLTRLKWLHNDRDAVERASESQKKNSASDFLNMYAPKRDDNTPLLPSASLLMTQTSTPVQSTFAAPNPPLLKNDVQSHVDERTRNAVLASLENITHSVPHHSAHVPPFHSIMAPFSKTSAGAKKFTNNLPSAHKLSLREKLSEDGKVSLRDRLPLLKARAASTVSMLMTSDVPSVMRTVLKNGDSNKSSVVLDMLEKYRPLLQKAALRVKLGSSLSTDLKKDNKLASLIATAKNNRENGTKAIVSRLQSRFRFREPRWFHRPNITRRIKELHRTRTPFAFKRAQKLNGTSAADPTERLINL